MISQKTVAFLHENNYGVTFSTEQVEVYHKTSIKIIWPVIAFVLGIAIIPAITMSGFEMGLFILLLLIFPAYKMLRDFRQPKNFWIDLSEKIIGIKSKIGTMKRFRLSDIEQVNLSTYDEYLEPNAFQEEIMHRHYFVELVFKNGHEKTIMAFKEVEESEVSRLIDELKNLLASSVKA